MEKIKKKKILFIALDIPSYRGFFNILKDNGFEVFTINLKWSHQSMSDWIKKTQKEILKLDIDKNTVIVGHSVGAVVALYVSQKYPSSKIVLFSPSPAFKETLKRLPVKSLKLFGKRRVSDVLENYSLYKICRNIKNQVEIYVGSEEDEIMNKTAKKIASNLSNGRQHMVKGRHHGDIVDASLV